MIGSIALVALALALLGCAIGVVATDNLVHSVFWLAAMLLATAGVYVALDASFIAMIQVLLYTGGVITMMLFGVLLTRRDSGSPEPTIVPNAAHGRPAGALVAGLVGGLLLLAIWTTPELAGRALTPSGSAAEVGRLFLDRYLIAFEALSVLLLAGMIGAIVLARRTDP